jgi:hypothetical protein
MFRREQQTGKISVPAVKAHRWIGGIAPLILNLGHYMELNCRPYAPAAVAPGKEPQYELNNRLGSVIFARSGVFGSGCGKFHMNGGKYKAIL